MKVIILAGGKATRLPQSAKNIPKSLVDVAGKPILQHQIDLLEKHGLNDVRFSLGYMADKIIDYLDGHYEYIVEPKLLGTGGAIKFASRDLKEDFMVLNGDILSDINLSEFIAKYQYNDNVSRQTLGVISLFFQEDASDYGLVRIENERVMDFLEKPSQKCSGHINTGFYILSPKIFENVSRETFSIERDIFPEMVRKGQLVVYIHKGYWTDLGTEERLEKAKNEFLMFNVKQ